MARSTASIRLHAADVSARAGIKDRKLLSARA
jgi:hypothetical protein